MRIVNEEPDERLELRRPIGIQILYNYKGGPSVHQIYEVFYPSGSRIVRGHSLRTLPGHQDLNGTRAQKEEAARSLRSDLEPAMIACHTLLERIANACWDLDLPVKRAPPRNRTGTSTLRKSRSKPLNQRGKKNAPR